MPFRPPTASDWWPRLLGAAKQHLLYRALSLCVSRACLGKIIPKNGMTWLKKDAFDAPWRHLRVVDRGLNFLRVALRGPLDLVLEVCHRVVPVLALGIDLHPAYDMRPT